MKVDFLGFCSPAYPPYLAPHMWIERIGNPPADVWVCRYCRDIGSWEYLHAVDCGHIHRIPCASCGNGMPYCEPDCSGVAAALSGQHVRGKLDCLPFSKLETDSLAGIVGSYLGMMHDRRELEKMRKSMDSVPPP